MVLTRSWRTYCDASTWVDWEVRKEGSRVTCFKINLCTIIGGRVLEACRYDTCHGRLHVHRYWLGSEETSDLAVAPEGGYRSQFEACARDMAANGPSYVAALRARRNPDE